MKRNRWWDLSVRRNARAWLKYLVVSLVYLLPVFAVTLAITLLAESMQASSQPNFLMLC